MRNFGSMSHNGKGLGEGGAKNDKTSNQTRTEQKPFSFFQNYKKNKKRNGFLRLIMTNRSTQEKFTPAFAKPMLN